MSCQVPDTRETGYKIYDRQLASPLDSDLLTWEKNAILID
jgi:hypothetical protein